MTVAQTPVDSPESPWNAPVVVAAWHDLRERMGTTRRLDGTHAWQHPCRVAHTMAHWGYDDPALLAAALLHDLVEDSDMSLGAVRARYGRRIHDCVAAVSTDLGVSEAQAFHELGQCDPVAQVLKVADRADNLCAAATRVRRSPVCGAWARRFLERSDVHVRPLIAHLAGPARLDYLGAQQRLGAALAG